MKNIIDVKDNVSKAASLLKEIAHESRLLVLCLLTQGEMCVGELFKHSNLSQSAFSQHLSVLRKANLVATRKEAQTIYYSIKDKNVEKILNTLYDIYCAK